MSPRGSSSWRSIGALLLAALAAHCAPVSAPPALTASSPAPQFEIRGQVTGRMSLSARPDDEPLVVLATPRSTAITPALRTTVIHRTDGTFSPSFLLVGVGERVSFRNEEDICHGFFSSSERNSFDLGLLNPGDSRGHQFHHPGPVHIYCSLHGGKQATILVAPTPHYGVVESDGSFSIQNLAADSYVLETWHDGARSPHAELAVPSHDAESVQISLAGLLSQDSG